MDEKTTNETNTDISSDTIIAAVIEAGGTPELAKKSGKIGGKKRQKKRDKKPIGKIGKIIDNHLEKIIIFCGGLLGSLAMYALKVLTGG